MLSEAKISAVEAVAEWVARILPETIEFGSEEWMLYIKTTQMCEEFEIREWWDGIILAKGQGELDA